MIGQHKHGNVQMKGLLSRLKNERQKSVNFGVNLLLMIRSVVDSFVLLPLVPPLAPSDAFALEEELEPLVALLALAVVELAALPVEGPVELAVPLPAVCVAEDMMTRMSQKEMTMKKKLQINLVRNDNQLSKFLERSSVCEKS